MTAGRLGRLALWSFGGFYALSILIAAVAQPVCAETGNCPFMACTVDSQCVDWGCVCVTDEGSKFGLCGIEEEKEGEE